MNFRRPTTSPPSGAGGFYWSGVGLVDSDLKSFLSSERRPAEVSPDPVWTTTSSTTPSKEIGGSSRRKQMKGGKKPPQSGGWREGEHQKGKGRVGPGLQREGGDPGGPVVLGP